MPIVVICIVTPPSVQVVDQHFHFGTFDAVTGGGVHPIAYLWNEVTGVENIQ